MGILFMMKAKATLVPNEFIDHHMAEAPGEYIKEYLYLLCHQDEPVEVYQISEALNHTEADVRRALSYWKETGVLHIKETDTRKLAMMQVAVGLEEVAAVSSMNGSFTTEAVDKNTVVDRAGEQIPHIPGSQASEAELTQILYIAQQYLQKVFTMSECDIFRNLYFNLQMSFNLLEYLLEYCAQKDHSNNVRYLEKTALNWHEIGIRSVEDARAHLAAFTNDTFAVMKAFKINNRWPGKKEREMINKWFIERKFSRELVLEACIRTVNAIEKPSFEYADRILQKWEKAGVLNLEDVEAIDKKHQGYQNRDNRGKKPNAFHNFQQRDTDYAALEQELVMSWMKDLEADE